MVMQIVQKVNSKLTIPDLIREAELNGIKLSTKLKALAKHKMVSEPFSRKRKKKAKNFRSKRKND